MWDFKKKWNKIILFLRSSTSLVKRIIWVIGACLYSLGPFSLLLLLIASSYFLFNKNILDRTNYLYFIFGGFGLLLGFFSYYINKTKINLELFEMRFEIYSDCLKALSKVMQDGTISAEDAINLLKGVNLHKARLLFSRQITDYLDDIYKKCIYLYYIGQERKGVLTQEMRSKLANEEHEIIIYLGDQIIQLPEVFEKYLSFKHIY